MIYQIDIPLGLSVSSDFDFFYDNPKAVKENLQELQMSYPRVKFQILREGTLLSDKELEADIESYEIALVREDWCQLPSTYRRGWSNTSDEVAKGSDGAPTKVWDPENPEDRFDLPGGPKPRR
jgi:hypothetical protein